MDTPDIFFSGFSGPWVHAPGSFSAASALAGFLSVSDTASCAAKQSVAPSSYGPHDTRIMLYFAPGCDMHQMPGDDNQRVRMDLLRLLTMKFLDAADIGCKLDREMLECGVEGEVSLVDATFTIMGMLLDEVLVWRLGHLLLQILAVHPVLLEDDDGNRYPVRFAGFGFMYL